MATNPEQSTATNATNAISVPKDKDVEEIARRTKRTNLKVLNLQNAEGTRFVSWCDDMFAWRDLTKRLLSTIQIIGF